MRRKRTATIALGPWTVSERPRVLIEHPDPDAALELAAALRRAGYTVGICRGPDADGSTRCPLHKLEPCVAVAGADVVVTALDFDSEEQREIVRGLRLRYAGTPVVVLATVAAALELGDVLAGCTVIPVDAAPERVAAEVRSALAG